MPESDFWKEETGWVLMRSTRPGAPEDTYLAFNTETSFALIIEDNEKARATHQRMLEGGIPVVEEFSPEEQRAMAERLDRLLDSLSDESPQPTSRRAAERSHHRGPDRWSR